MEAAYIPEMSVSFHWTADRHVQENSIPHSDHHGRLKSSIL
jgi:hypothetical protein